MTYDLRQPFIPGSEKPEHLYDELSRLGAELKIPVPQIHVRLQSYDRRGKLIHDHAQRSRTFTRNFWNIAFAGFVTQVQAAGSYGAGYLGIKATSGTIRVNSGTEAVHLNPSASSQQLTNQFQVGGNNGSSGAEYSVGFAADATNGVVVGTGTAAENFEDFALGSRCAEGTGSNQFNYQTQQPGTPSYNSGSLTWTNTLTRQMNNNGSGTIVVGEVGIYAKCNWDTSFRTNDIFMIERSLLGATVSVLAGGLLTVTYSVTCTFPA